MTGTTTVELIVRLDGSVGDPTNLGLNYSGTVQNGVDVKLLPSSVLIPAGQIQATLTITPLGTKPFSSKELVVTLSSSDSPCVDIGCPNTAMLTLLGTLSAETWQPSGTISGTWSALAASAAGSTMLAVDGGAGGAGGPIYVSPDSGLSWIRASSPVLIWTSVATSADGTHSLAVAYNAGVYTSGNSGMTWTTTTAPINRWNACACSSDGTKLFAAAFGGPIYRSTNSGAAWIQTSAPQEDWYALASSADGTKLVGAVGGSATVPTAVGSIWVSKDSGQTWSATSAPRNNWAYVACSADGTKLVAVVYNGNIFHSTDSGATWRPTAAPIANWVGVASSADGTKLVAVANGDLVYTSADSGASWTTSAISAFGLWAATCSADGAKLLVADEGSTCTAGGLYQLQSTEPPPLSLTFSGSSPVASWPVPSMKFTLQGSSDLSGTNWTDLALPAKLDIIKLRNEVVLPGGSSYQFFRLKH